MTLLALFLLVGWLMLGRDQTQQNAIRAHYAPQNVSISRAFKRCLANGLRYRVNVNGKGQDVCVKQGAVIENW